MEKSCSAVVTDSKSILAHLEETQNRVKSHPTDLNARMQLFSHYCIQAEWNSAWHQLEIATKLEPEAKRQCELYKNLLLSERLREQILAGEREAAGLQEPQPDWIKQLTRANAYHTAGRHDEGERLRYFALEAAVSRAGNCDALSDFDWIADGDERLGPVCEFIVAGGYRWVPFSQVNRLITVKPVSLIHLIWAPATLLAHNQRWQGFIPARYPVTPDTNEHFKLGRQTVWHDQHGRYTGLGRKMWITGRGECSLFEAEDISFSEKLCDDK